MITCLQARQDLSERLRNRLLLSDGRQKPAHVSIFVIVDTAPRLVTIRHYTHELLQQRGNLFARCGADGLQHGSSALPDTGAISDTRLARGLARECCLYTLTGQLPRRQYIVVPWSSSSRSAVHLLSSTHVPDRLDISPSPSFTTLTPSILFNLCSALRHRCRSLPSSSVFASIGQVAVSH